MAKIYKIYSRKRLNLGLSNFRGNHNKGYTYKFNTKKIKRIIWVFAVLAIAFLVCFSIWRAITPIFETLSKDEAKNIATTVTNEETTKIMNKYNYDTFFTMEKDANGNIQMISANVLRVNQITSDIALNIQNALKNNSENKIEISLGSLTGIRMLSGSGPKIPVKLMFVGNVETNLKSEFTSQGVNQTLHRVFLEVNSTVNILTPYSTIEEKIENQVLILENVIVGNIPSSYYNFNGIENSNQALELVE